MAQGPGGNSNPKQLQGSPQQGVAQGVYDHIAIGVRQQALVVRNGDAAQYERTPRGEPVRVITVPYSHCPLLTLQICLGPRPCFEQHIGNKVAPVLNIGLFEVLDRGCGSGD